MISLLLCAIGMCTQPVPSTQFWPHLEPGLSQPPPRWAFVVPVDTSPSGATPEAIAAGLEELDEMARDWPCRPFACD